MYRPLLHIREFFMAVAVVLLALIPLSCSDDMGGEIPETGFCNVGLRLTLDEIGGTKAPEGSYDDGRSTPYENYINVIDGDFRLMLFEATAPYRLVTEIKNIEITAVEADVYTSKTYILLGQVPASVRNASYKLLFVANWRGCDGEYPELVPGETTIDGLAEASTYGYVSGFRPGSGRGIPMFGIKDCENLEFKEDVFTDFGKLHLLRAMAKIEVRPSEYGLPIADAVMTRSNDAGLAVPRKIYSQTDYVKNSYIMDYLDTIHIPESTEVTDDIPFFKQDDGSFVLYVPEYDNTSPSASATMSRIHLKFDASDGIDEIYFDGDVDFKYYSAQAALDAGKNVGDRFDVKRNHYYRYTVTKKVDLSMEIVVDVIPYSEVNLEPGFGL